jgi:hypothetical protein
MIDLVTHVLAATVPNPYDGVDIRLDVFGIVFKNRVQLILGGLWALALVGSGAAVLVGAAKWSWSAKVSHSSEGVMESAGQFRTAMMGFGAVAGVSIITGALIWVSQG